MSDLTPTRWRPNRAGIRNVWEYDEQVFTFAGGRMILRGPNGSGKSNALALLFPFLFDGTMSAAAMDPFAGGRSMKSLLLGVVRDDARAGRYRHDQRLGYVWMEFVGPEGHLTIGCGARATNSGDVRSWFFVTPKRVGVDLDLAPDNTPLTRPKLSEALGQGAVHETAEAYRQAVDRQLLGLGTDQLTKLNQLIRALRRPQLAGKLDLDALSSVLSSGLPALPAEMLDDVADSLDDLERVQRELTDVREALATVEAFLPPYLRYLNGEAHLRIAAVLDADRKVADEERRLAKLQRDQKRLREDSERLASEEQRTTEARSEASAKRDALRESDRYRSVQELEQVEELARVARAAHEAAEKRRAEADERSADAGGRAERAASEAAEISSDADRQLQHVIDQADHLDAVWSLPTEAHPDPDRLDATLAVMVRERREASARMRGALQRFADAARDHERAADALTAAQERAEEAVRTVADRDGERAEGLASLTELAETWADGAPALDDEGRRDLLEQLDLVGTPEAVRLGDRYRQLTAAERDRLRDDRNRLHDELARIEAEREKVAAERAEVAAEVNPGPVAPPWRDAVRSDRPGAPLWASADFAASGSLDQTAQARIEAALDAAGILDAWISPGPPTDEFDAWLTATGDAGPTAGPTLADVLVPSVPEDSGLDVSTVRAVLEGIGLGRLGIAVDPTGRFTLGPLTGRADKPEPEFIGITARAERRERRLRELDATLTGLADAATRTQGRRDERDQQIAAIERTADTAPDTTPLADAIAKLRSAQREAELLDDRAIEAAHDEATAAAAVVRADGERIHIAGNLRLPADEDELNDVDARIQMLAVSGQKAVSSRRNAVRAAAHAADASEALTTARADVAARTTEAEVAAAKAHEDTTRADTLRANVGADAVAVVVELEQLADEITAHDRSLTQLRADASELTGQTGEVRANVGAAESDIERARSSLGKRATRLPVIRRRDLLALLLTPDQVVGQEADQGLDVEDTELPTDPVEFARWLTARLEGATPSDEDHARAKRAIDDAQKLLLDDLHRGYSPGIVHRDDIVTIEVTSDEGSFGLAVLVERLTSQVADMERHLTDGDREVFERHLLNRISHELRRLLGDADEFVLGVNGALERTRTASGLRVELAWSPDTDDRPTANAIGLLRRDTDQMGDDDRAALRDFFDQAIRRQRAEDPDAGYRATLEQVLDYRRWHRFQPYLHSPDGGRAKLTRSKFRELSGGEQAVALHLPLFAAAAAHYDRADDRAPRLVALDEAFAGIDEAMRGELLALTVEFDLDVLLTGHELWGAYAEVPEIAVPDLLRRPPAEGVRVFTLRWNGQKLVDAPPEPALAPTSAAAIDDGLFSQPTDPADPDR